MPLKFNAKLVGAGLALMTSFLFEVAIADQDEFQSRREQQLRPHDFDVQHYRIELSLDEPTKSFVGETAIRFSSTISDLHDLTLDAESFTVDRVTQQGTPLAFTHTKGRLELIA